MTTQKERIAELESQLAEAQDRAERVHAYRFPWKNHPDGDHFGVTLRTRDGKLWAILLELGLGHTHSWNGDDWIRRGDLLHTEVYRWTLAEAEELAPGLAEQSEKDHPTAPGQAERDFADQLDDIIRQSRTAMETFKAEPYDQILARMGFGAAADENLAEFAAEVA